MANLYPANQSLSVSIAKLNNAASLFLETPKEIEEVRKSIDASIAELLAKVEELISLANKRASARAEISHYQDKIAKLADDAKSAGDPKKQGKAESNQAKCVFALSDVFATDSYPHPFHVQHQTSRGNHRIPPIG